MSGEDSAAMLAFLGSAISERSSYLEKQVLLLTAEGVQNRGYVFAQGDLGPEVIFLGPGRHVQPLMHCIAHLYGCGGIGRRCKTRRCLLCSLSVSY